MEKQISFLGLLFLMMVRENSMAKKSQQKGKEKKPLKALFRDAIRENAERYYDKDFDKLNNIEMSRCMTRTYVETINRQKYPEIMPMDEEDYQRCDTDAAGDLNIDFICRDNNTVVIIQSKYHHKGSKDRTEDRTEFVDFCEVLKRLYDGDYKGNEKVSDMAREIDWDNDRFCLEFNTLAKASDNIRKREEKGHYEFEDLPSGLQDRTDIIFNDEEDLNIEYRSYSDWTSGITAPVKVVPVKIDDNQSPWLICKSSNGKREAYVGVVNGKQLRELYKPKTVQNKLFASNIRNPMGVSTTINKEIRKTAIESSEEFFFYNNGLSAIADSIDMEPNGDLKCKRLSVINGAQTVKSLVKSSRIPNENTLLGNAQVLIRIIKISVSEKEKETRFTRNVIRFNNTQNKIVASDFCSNEPIQLDLEKKFLKLKGVKGKSFCYLRKRTDVRGKKDLIKITKESFARNIHSFLYGSPEMYGGLNKLFDSTSSDGRYVHVFGDGTTVHDSFEEKDFLKLAGIYFFSDTALGELKKEKEKRIEDENKIIKANPKKIPVVKNALYSNTLFVSTLGVLLRTKYRQLDLDLDDDLIKIGKPKWVEENGNIVTNLKLYTSAVATILTQVYSASSQRPDFTARNWFKKQTTLTDVKDLTDNLAFDFAQLKGITTKD
jgi:hypothetical protein